MITKLEALNIIAEKHGLSSWMYASMIKQTIELEEIIFAAMDLYTEQSNSHKHDVSGSDRLYQLAKEFGLDKVTEEDIERVVEEAKRTRSASGAVDTVAEGGMYCVSSNSLVYGKGCDKWCGDMNCWRGAAPAKGQP